MQVHCYCMARRILCIPSYPRNRRRFELPHHRSRKAWEPQGRFGTGEREAIDVQGARRLHSEIKPLVITTDVKGGNKTPLGSHFSWTISGHSRWRRQTNDIATLATLSTQPCGCVGFLLCNNYFAHAIFAWSSTLMGATANDENDYVQEVTMALSFKPPIDDSAEIVLG